jgi:tetratricopeptide (TPR) repeat protein
MTSVRPWLLVVLVLTVVVFSSSFQNGLLNWDDPVNVTQNHAIRAFSGANVRTWFTEPLLGMYSPLVYLSFAVDYAIGGKSPVVYHATNLALHLACVLLVFGIVNKLTAHPIAALLAAGVFAVHPANVAAVTPISVRSSLLYSALYLAAYRTYLWHLDRPAIARVSLAFALFVAAGLSKSAAAVLPLAMILTDWYRERPFSRTVIVEKLPFLAVAVVFGGLTLALRHDVALADPLQTTWIERAALGLYQLGHYAFTAIVPANLSPFYPYPERVAGSLPVAVFVVPLIVLVIVAVVALARSLRRPLTFGLLFFALHLALVLKIVPVGEEFTADRYLYLPLIGLLIAGVELLTRLPPRLHRPAAWAAILLVAVFSVSSYARSPDWRDDMAFNTRILERYPRTATALSNRAAAKLQAGDVDGAHRDSTEAIRIDSSNARAYFNRATAEMLRGRPLDALADANRLIDLDPALAAAYELRAQARLRTDDLRGALADSSKAIELAPDWDEVFKSYVTRGLARAMLNDNPGALADLDRAASLNPTEPAILLNRGQVRINAGDTKGGCDDLREALKRGREDARALVKSRCGP